MIILYAIAGLVTLLFLVVVLFGAVRAIRHPERYGPRRRVYRDGDDEEGSCESGRRRQQQHRERLAATARGHLDDGFDHFAGHSDAGGVSRTTWSPAYST